jgi:hypothetical protein
MREASIHSHPKASPRSAVISSAEVLVNRPVDVFTSGSVSLVRRWL